MREHRDRHADLDTGVHLEGGTQCHTVQHAVAHQGPGRERARRMVVVVRSVRVFVTAVQGHGPLDQVEQQETRDEQQQRHGSRRHRCLVLGQCLRQQLESDDAEHQAGRQTENKLAVTARPQRGQSADERRECRPARDENRCHLASPWVC